MRKLFFLATMALHSTLIFTAGTMPWPGDDSKPDVIIIYPGKKYPIDSNQPESKPIPPKATTPPPSLSRRLETFLNDDQVQSTIQQVGLSVLEALEEKKKRPQLDSVVQHQNQPYQKPYNGPNLKADAITIQEFGQRSRVITEPIAEESQVAAISDLEKKLKEQQEKIEKMTCVINLIEKKQALSLYFDEDEDEDPVTPPTGSAPSMPNISTTFEQQCGGGGGGKPPKDDKKPVQQQLDNLRMERKDLPMKSLETQLKEQAAFKKEADKQRAIDLQKAKAVVAAEDKKSGSQKPRHVRNARALIKSAQLRKENDAAIDLLPRYGQNAFVAKNTKEGTPPRDIDGAFIDKEKRAWTYNYETDTWDVKYKDKKGEHLVSVAPLSTTVDTICKDQNGNLGVYVLCTDGKSYFNQEKTDLLHARNQIKVDIKNKNTVAIPTIAPEKINQANVPVVHDISNAVNNEQQTTIEQQAIIEVPDPEIVALSLPVGHDNQIENLDDKTPHVDDQIISTDQQQIMIQGEVAGVGGGNFQINEATTDGVIATIETEKPYESEIIKPVIPTHVQRPQNAPVVYNINDYENSFPLKAPIDKKSQSLDAVSKSSSSHPTEFIQKPVSGCDEWDKKLAHHNNMPEEIADQLHDGFMLVHNEDFGPMSEKELAMIDFMLNSMVHAQNNMTVELAQTGLQAWNNAQQAQTNEEYAHYIQKSQACYNMMQNNSPTQSIGQHVKLVNSDGIDDLMEQYQTQIQAIKRAKASNAQPDVALYYNQCEKRFENRQQALVITKEQIRTNDFKKYEYKMSSDTRDFMMLNNLNYTAFDPMNATAFQDCLAKENLEIIESSVRIAAQSGFAPEIKDFTQQRCNLAVAAQQLNQLSKIEESAAVTNINHVLSPIEQEMYELQLEREAWKSLGRGVYKGTARSLKKWDDFLMRLGHEPGKTIGEMGQSCKAIGNCLVSGLVEIGQFNPAIYADDAIRDLIDNFKKDTHFDETMPSRVQLRNERNLQSLENGVVHTINTAQNIIINMIEKSFEDNIADFTELTVDCLITNKIADSLINVSKFVGSALIEAGCEIAEVIPPHLLDSTVEYTMNGAGELIAIADTTGESIGAAVAAAGKKLLGPLENGIHLAAQSNNLARKGGGSSNGGKPEVEPKISKYTYENGKTHPSKKHNKNSPDGIGKPPRDAQDALDKSFTVKDSKERVAVQDGNIICLKKTSDGLYHGYIIEDFFSIENPNVQHALVDNGLVRSMKSGKVIK